MSLPTPAFTQATDQPTMKKIIPEISLPPIDEMEGFFFSTLPARFF
jgi:hypothetical protein